MRLRLRFTKTGKIRWTSHRDVARMWERAFRRTSLPLAYSVGFSPRPKVSFGLALSTGHESVAEYLDLEIDVAAIDDPAHAAALELDSLPARLTAALPDGLEVTDVRRIDERRSSLQHEVTSSTFEMVLAGGDAAEITKLVADALGAEDIVIARTRKGQTVDDDVRPGIVDAVVIGDHTLDDGRTGVLVSAELATQPRGLRPAEFLTALSPALEELRVRRTHQWISRDDGARVEPLDEVTPLDASDAPPAPQYERVS